MSPCYFCIFWTKDTVLGNSKHFIYFKEVAYSMNFDTGFILISLTTVSVGKTKNYVTYIHLQLF